MDPRSHRVMGWAVAAVGALALGAWLVPAASAAPKSHGQVVHIVKPGLHGNTNQSSNWFGYNQGTLEQGGKQFNSIEGDWVVPTATQHTAGQDEYSSTWIGIGGGCIDANCTVGDSTLIQTGTEQDVGANGAASYSAWYEVIPAPSIGINMSVAPGDRMHADVSEVVSGAEIWKITLQDVTRGETFTTTIPYSSTHATAEWIEETPLIIGANAGLAALPDLTKTPFTNGKVNGAPAGLDSAEEMQLVDSNGTVIGTPSAPNATADGFSLCAWATICS